MKIRYLLLFVLITTGLYSKAQIINSSVYSEATEYSDSDFVFVFCSDINNIGELTAQDSSGHGSYNFEWFKYNEGTSDFTDILTGFSITNDSVSSTISNLEVGGYKVILTKQDTTQEYIAWLYITNELNVNIEFHPDNDCDFLALRAQPYFNAGSNYFDTPFTYYDPETGTSYVLRNKIEDYEWTANPEKDSFRSYNGSYTSIGEDPTDNDSELPTENTTFSIVIKDKFGCQAEDEIFYQAIETDADFTWLTLDDKLGTELENGNSDSEITGPAPLSVVFTNASLNAEKFAWFHGDTLWDVNATYDSTLTYDDKYEHVYRITVADSGKTYVMRLFSESPQGCRDSIFFNIKVEPSLIEFPNVFTPNGDGVNDDFVLIDYKSIRSFKITIFNRVGQVAHEYEGDVRDWEGWNGKVRDSNRDAPEGNYFFVVEVTGWDNVNYNNNNLGDAANQSTQDGETGTDTGGGGGAKFGVIRLYR